MKVSEIMNNSPVTVEENSTAGDAANLMNEHGIGALPVVENSSVKGMITDRDIVLRCLALNKDPYNTAVSSLMSGQVFSVAMDDSVNTALNKMGENKVQRLPVITNGRLCGMLSLSDIARQHMYDELSETVADIKSEY